MNEIKELQNLIHNTDFDIDVSELYCSDSEFNFETSVTKTGVYLRYEIIAEEHKFIVHEKMMFESKTTTISKKEYGIEDVKRIIDDLSNTLSRLVEIDNTLESNFKDFEEYSIPRSTKEWKQQFINELTEMFGSPRTVILSGGIKLVVAFEEETNLIKITLAKGLFFDDEKTLLHGFVSESNYKDVLDIIEKIYDDFKYRFYDVNGIAEELKYLD